MSYESRGDNDPILAPMIGRRVRDDGYGARRPGEIATVVRWEPYGAAMCDVLIRFADGFEIWTASHMLRPVFPGSAHLPARREACAANNARSRAQLLKIRADHVRDFRKPWPGCEHGKAIIGRAIDMAIASTEES